MDGHQPQSRVEKLRSSIADSYYQTKHDLWKVQQYNLQTFRRQPLAEISGSVGDLGTLLPLLIALTDTKSIYLSSTLVFSGLANIFTGVAFGIPLPVQPMKAIAAVAIARGFSPAKNASVGLFVAAAIGFLSFTGLIQWFTRKVPIPVVKGIQVGTGLSLLISAGNLYSPLPGNAAVLLAAFLALLASTRYTRVPYALIILLVGIIFLAIDRSTNPCIDCNNSLRFEIWHPKVLVPSIEDFGRGTLEAGIGQLPLTALNSVIAVTFLAADLLPDVPTPSTTSIGMSIMGINLVACWFGAMPVCHGSGGLAAQYRFGARSGASIIFLGLVKLLLGLFAENMAHWVFLNFPKTLLCILVLAAGLEMVKVGESLNTDQAPDLSARPFNLETTAAMPNAPNSKVASNLTDEERKRRWTIMFMTVAGIMAFRNDAVGFLAGMLCVWSYQLLDRWESRTGPQGRIRLDT